MSEHFLIIGGTKGSGLVLVKKLIGRGSRVSVIGQESLSKDLTDIVSLKTDITDKPQLLKALKSVLDKNGKVDHIVFFQRFRGTGDDWTGELEVSLTATKTIIEKLKDKFTGKGNNSIVIISSVAGELVASEQPVSYHVAKAGIEQMVRYYAVFLGKKGIRVNAVSPGSIMKEEARPFYLKNKKLLGLIESIIPLDRMGTSDDVIGAVMFLAGRDASFITGQNLRIDGGLSLIWQEALARELVIGKKRAK